ncbi:MAG: phosphate acyltransferase PlsX [Chloroflexi bacterium]|nr:phosphate acyltransferase PlsX [Chloroflexota bacterium]
MIIAVDAAGGDYAPQEIVKGAVEASSVKSGEASAFVSAGNTGAVLASSFLLLERLPGIERPAICVVVPVSTGGPFLLLDAGANADCQPRFLVQFAILGAAFARLYLGIKSPRIGLLNNGEEELKGSSLTKETYQLLKETGMNFIGNIEGQDILKDRADVLVTDGFTGNIVLKTMEGFGDMLQDLLSLKKEAPKSSGNGQFGTLIKHMDFSESGGSCLLGLRGNVIICHGRSKARAIKNAIKFAGQAAGAAMAEAITNELKQCKSNT